MCQHLRISALTGKRVKGDDDSAIREHLLFCNYTPDFEDFSILATSNNDFKVKLMESLLINRDDLPLNKQWRIQKLIWAHREREARAWENQLGVCKLPSGYRAEPCWWKPPENFDDFLVKITFLKRNMPFYET